MVTLICDCETNGLLDAMPTLHLLQIGDAETDEVQIYCDLSEDDVRGLLGPKKLQRPVRPLSEGVERMKAADRLVFHNGMGFDVHALNRFYPGAVDPLKVFDTLIAARLDGPEEKMNRLRDWGERLGVAKGDYEGDFQKIDADLLIYAEQDIVVTRALYRYLLPKVGDWKCIPTEMAFAFILSLQEQNGFLLDVKAAQELDSLLRGELEELTKRLQTVFPPIERSSVIVPKANNSKLGYVKGVPFTKRKMESFNPASRQQIAERLKLLGWKPQKFGKDGTPTIDDAVLSSLRFPEAKELLRFFTVQKQLGQISDGKNGWLKLVKKTGRVHGRVNTVGCAPGRCSHNKPNMAQVNKKDHRMRAVWIARPGWKLVGCDGEGLQARVLAHYIARYDGGEFAERVANGDKKQKTDVHSVNLREIPYLQAGFNAAKETFGKARDGAKTCLYCVLFGGQDPKLGRTVKEACRDAALPIPRVPDRELGALSRRALFRAIRGFDKLAEQIQERSARGYLIGIDGRHIKIRSKHSALVFLMQAGEAAVMKLAKVIFHFETVPEKGWVCGEDFAYCANVHDEVQIEAREEIAEEIGKAFAWCITEAGRRLGMKCPLAGDYAVGSNWAETH